MSNTKSSGGLGRAGFFKTTGAGAEVDSSAQAAPTPPKKVRTTVTVYPKTLSAMEQLKMELRKSGDKVTLSDVLDEAIWTLMEKKGLAS